ncbi:MAG TPA: hypothetical protein VGF20_15515 [Candidatus Acidoferrum sp.]|jgi:hypothetical protein
MTTPPESNARTWPIAAWFLPALLGFALFLVSFPIDRRIPFWPHPSLVDLFAMWFVFIAPVATVIGVVVLIKRGRHGLHPVNNFLLWIAVLASVAVNWLMLVGMWAATY